MYNSIDHMALQNAIASTHLEEMNKVLDTLKTDKVAFKKNLQPNGYNTQNALHLAANTPGIVNGLLVNKLILDIKNAFEDKEARTLLRILIEQNKLFTNHACSFENVRRMIRDHFPGFSCQDTKPFLIRYQETRQPQQPAPTPQVNILQRNPNTPRH